MSQVFGAGDYQYEVVENWGRSGERPKLGLVSSVAVDSQDNVYVFQRSPEAVMLVFDPDGTLKRTWGQDIFVEPHGVWIGPDDTIYTADSLDHTVRCFTGAGELLWTLGTPGQTGSPGLPFNRPTWAVVAPSGELYVSDGYGQNRWHRFDSERRLLNSWGETGSGPGQFLLPHAVWVDRDNQVYVIDRTNQRVQLFTLEGEYLTEWTEMPSPNQLFIGEDDTVYIAQGARRIDVMTLEGDLLSSWGEEGELPGQFLGAPHSIWADSHSDLYVSEVGADDRLQKFVRK